MAKLQTPLKNALEEDILRKKFEKVYHWDPTRDKDLHFNPKTQKVESHKEVHHG